MELDLKFSRFESAPWGFRLVGGADFELPLTVVKEHMREAKKAAMIKAAASSSVMITSAVARHIGDEGHKINETNLEIVKQVTEGGLAEQAGMRIGDTVIRINEKSTEEMSHTDVHKTITECGNNFFLTVYREENPEGDFTEDDEVVEAEVQAIFQANSHQENHVEDIEEAESETCQFEESREQVVEETLTREVESTSEENVTQVETRKSGICLSSEVFQTIKEESWKAMIGKDKDKRKWTTFLQKPNRPIPKSKFDPEVVSEPYRVQIIKQPKPRVAPDRIPTPPPAMPEEIPAKGEDSVVEEEAIAPEHEELLEPPTDSEVPNLEPTEVIPSESGEQSDPVEVQVEAVDTNQEEPELEKSVEPESIEEPKKTEEELMFERQLSDIQKQLLALSSLPSTIQATLDAVTRQLSGLLPNVKLDVPAVSNNVERGECFTPEKSMDREVTLEEDLSTTQIEVSTNQIQESCCENNLEEERNCEVSERIITSETEVVEECHETSQEVHKQTIIQTNSHEEIYEEDEFIAEEHSAKSQKDLVLLELEHKQRLIKERASKRPPRAFGPLTPQERPLVLPGGRKWRRPKDAFNDEFIADILSSQAELIIGHTLGTTFECTNITPEQRVNFLKYKKPEKHIDLEKSEVYKVIHSLDNAPRRGIEVRPEKVMAAADVCSDAGMVS